MCLFHRAMETLTQPMFFQTSIISTRNEMSHLLSLTDLPTENLAN